MEIQINELALFAGCGGGIIGTHQIGINTICAVEYEEHRIQCLLQRQSDGALPIFPIWDDVRTMDAAFLAGKVDMVSGGFPCQAFSTASRGRITAENLWPEMRRIVSECLPSYVFAENVQPRAIEQAGEDLEEMGYTVEMLALSAKDLGADHIRERYWLLAHTDDKGKLQRCINAKMGGVQKLHEGVWEAAPGQSGVDDGVSSRSDRYQASGNGQVPLVAAAALIELAFA